MDKRLSESQRCTKSGSVELLCVPKGSVGWMMVRDKVIMFVRTFMK